MTHRVIFGRDELDLIAALAGCSLNEKPGKNWVEKTPGGLPTYICEIARAVKRSGKSTSQAIAIAVSRVKKWAAGGDDVDADTRAKAAKALAAWEKLKSNNAAKQVKATRTRADVLCLSTAVDFNVDMIRKAFDQATSQARRDWRAANPNSSYDDGPPYWYIKEQWTNYLIVQNESAGYGSSAELYKVPYSVDAQLDVTFADPVQVKTEYVVIDPATDLGDTLSDTDLRTLIGLTATDPADVIARLAAPRGSALQRVLDHRG